MRSVFAASAVLILLSAGACGWVAIDRHVRIVKVEGPLAETEAAQIRRQIGRVLDGRLLTMDVAQLRKRVMELSWPGEVSVRKVWPDTIVVRVSRRTVVARWADQGYLTPAGEIVITPNGPADVPVFDCALSTPKEAMEVYRYLQSMTADVGLLIQRVSENEIGEWRLAIVGPVARKAVGPTGLAAENDLAMPDAAAAEAQAGPEARLEVMLGADSLRERMQRFLVAWSRMLEQRADSVDYVDLRYGNGIAVRWREPNRQHAEAARTAVGVGTT